MDRFVVMLEGEFCRNLLSALAHTLWQGALAASILFLYLRRIPAQVAGKRYLAGIAALGSVVLGGLLTWSVLSYKPNDVQQVRRPAVATETTVASANPMTSAPAASSGGQARATEPSCASSPWQVWLIEAWIAGVVAMLLRLIIVVIGAGRLRRSCRPTEDAELLAIIKQLRDRTGILRNIRVLVGERIATPGVIGCFWPTLLLPVTMTTGIPAEDLQAILAHELAHIQRYDYLVNFVQMVVEALLFFNPAVWWISRQIRIEREACCDAAGVLWTGQGVKYAAVLVAWAQRTAALTPAVGFGESTDSGRLLDRVRRVLMAGHQPRPRVPWHIAVAMVVLTFACVLVLQQTTSLAVALAGHILTPQERIERIGELSQEYGSPDQEYGPEDGIEVSGVVRTWDSAPLPTDNRLDNRLMLEYRKHNGGGGTPIRISKNGEFREIVNYCNEFYLIALAKGYAPAFAGPFQAEPGGKVEGIALVLAEGFPGRIRIVDEKGQPVSDARLTGGYAYPYRTSYQHAIDLTTDANGLATLNHTAALRVSMEIDAAGFELAHVGGFEPGHVESFVLDPETTRTVTLTRARPMTGVVLAETTSKPIAEAEIRVFISAGRDEFGGDNFIWGKPDAITDVQGKFELGRLRQGRKHLLFVRASGYGYRYVPDVEAGDRDIKVVLGPKKVIRGTITGDLSLLDTDPNSGRPIVQVANSYEYPRHSTSSSPATRAPVTIREGVGQFEVEDFWGQTVALSAGPEKVRLNVEKDRLDAVTINLQPPVRRLVVLRFPTAPGAPPVTGTVQLDYTPIAATQDNEHGHAEYLDIQDNQASCEIPVPAAISYGFSLDKGKRPIGYWFNPVLVTYIPPGRDPFIIDVPVHPAGAICGRILRPDGSLALNARATLMTVKQPEIADGQGFFRDILRSILHDRVDRGTFNATPLPLGGTYAIVGYEGYALAQSDAFALDEKSPIVNVDLRLPPGIDVEGRQVNIDGSPARSELSLHIGIKQGEQWFSAISGAPIRPDEAGRFVFKNVNPGPQGVCLIEGIGETGCRPFRHWIENLGAPVIIQLEKGLRVTGTLIDDTTGRPMPDEQVYARSVPASKNGIDNDLEILAAEEPTDEQGRFVFSNMAPRQYELGIADPGLAPAGPAPIVTGGQAASVVLRARVSDGNNLNLWMP
jgi:beta-lactamase regulating signal transducer with metallopeptidase domain